MTVLDDFRASFDERVQRPARARKARPPLLSVLAKTLGMLAAIVLGFGRRARTGLLSVAGLAFGVLAAFDYSRIAGLAALAASAFILEWLMRE